MAATYYNLTISKIIKNIFFLLVLIKCVLFIIKHLVSHTESIFLYL